MIEAITGEPYRGLDRARDRRRRRFARDHADMPLAKGIPFARGHTPSHSRRPAPCHSRRQCDPRHDAGRRLRQHRGRRGPLLRATGAECEAQRALRRQPPGDDPKTLAQSACQPGGILRSWHHERLARRLGLVRPYRRIPGLCLTDLRHPRPRSGHHHPDQFHRWLGLSLARRRHAYPARLCGARRTRKARSRLDRALVEHVGRGRSGSDGKSS